MATTEEKQAQWDEFAREVQQHLRRGPARLRSLSGAQLIGLIDRYQRITADLARARSLGAPPSTVAWLNRLAVAGHNLLYGSIRRRIDARRRDWLFGFARAVRASGWAFLLAVVMLFGPALISYFAVQLHPELGYDLVPEGFQHFNPAREDNLHDIPSLFRPVASSAIVSNNIQVTLLAFGLGLTAGLGTTFVLVTNGISLGSVAGWMRLHGKDRALWGWIMPHGGTELLAICLAGSAGYLLAGALLVPGQLRRATALKRVGTPALVIELGCMAMLVVAGVIEGFVSPSSIGYPARIAVLVVSLSAWAAYFLLGGRRTSA